MIRLFGKLFGHSGKRALARARGAELRGDLAQAAALFAEGGRLDEAARVMVLRGDAETSPMARLLHYVQAAATAPGGSTVLGDARRKRALLTVAIAADAPLTEGLRHDLLDAARELEALGENERAAEAYVRARDIDGQVRALARAGDVERLDALLQAQQGLDREARAGQQVREEFRMLVGSGRRKEAAALARASKDDALRERCRALEARRVAGSVVYVTVSGRRAAIVLGERIVVGRAPEEGGREAGLGSIAVPSVALSRRHVAIERRGGDIVVRDLGSRNGTTIRGLTLAGDTVVGEGIELRLGRDVPLVVRPGDELPNSVAIEIAGARYTASLGPASLGIGRWRLERDREDWVELVTDDEPPAFAGELQLTPRVTLLVGDEIANARGGEPRVVLEAQ
jgi:hypothetical protein